MSCCCEPESEHVESVAPVEEGPQTPRTSPPEEGPASPRDPRAQALPTNRAARASISRGDTEEDPDAPHEDSRVMRHHPHGIIPRNLSTKEQSQGVEITPTGSSTSRSVRTQYLESKINGEAVTAPTDTEGWSCVRKFFYDIIRMNFPHSHTNIFDTTVGVLVAFNMILMILDTDMSADCTGHDCVPQWIQVADILLLCVYTVECVVRLYVFRVRYFLSVWNLLDASIVLCGIAAVVLADYEKMRKISVLRTFRVLRIIRVLKILKRLPTLRNMLAGFFGAMHAMFWGWILIMMLLIMMSLLAVELIHPVVQHLPPEEYELCKDAFSTVLRSTLTFFQTLVAGDSWGRCAVPIIHKDPFTYVVFGLALVVVQLGFTNLVLAIIVDKAAEAREASKEEKILADRNHEKESLKSWKQVMKQLDADESGSLSHQELMAANDHPQVAETLIHSKITKKDLFVLFDLMDSDDNGSLDYAEFVDAMSAAQTQDPRIYLMFIQLRLQKVHQILQGDINQQFKELKNLMTNSLRAPDSRRSYPETAYDEARDTRNSPGKLFREDLTFGSAPPVVHQERLQQKASRAEETFISAPPEWPATGSDEAPPPSLRASGDHRPGLGSPGGRTPSAREEQQPRPWGAKGPEGPEEPQQSDEGGSERAPPPRPGPHHHHGHGGGYAALAEALCDMRRSLEARLDALAAEAAASSTTHLAQRVADLLEATKPSPGLTASLHSPESSWARDESQRRTPGAVETRGGSEDLKLHAPCADGALSHAPALRGLGGLGGCASSGGLRGTIFALGDDVSPGVGGGDGTDRGADGGCSGGEGGGGDATESRGHSPCGSTYASADAATGTLYASF